MDAVADPELSLGREWGYSLKREYRGNGGYGISAKGNGGLG